MARRDEREYRAYLREEQRREAGCPARELCEVSGFQGTSPKAHAPTRKPSSRFRQGAISRFQLTLVRSTTPSLAFRDHASKAKTAEFRYPLHVKRAVLIYGIAGGVLIAALRFTEYRFLVVEHSLEIYGGLIALVFATVGVWLGLTITRKEVVKEEVIVVKEVPAAPAARFTVDEDRRRALGVTPRELEILGLLAQGLSAKEMAAALFVSENTVKTHTARLFDKLRVNRRIRAVEAGRTFGLIP